MMDPKIKEAIYKAVDEKDQPEAVAMRLIAWINAVISGNEDLNSIEASTRHLDLLFEAVMFDFTPEEETT